MFNFLTRSKRPLSTKIIERLPQTVYLRSDMKIYLRNRTEVGAFWHIFTSAEYMALLPELLTLPVNDMTLIDCGAGIGLFSMLIEHLRRIDVLPWKEIFYVMVEPSSKNFQLLSQNATKNLPVSNYEIVHGLVGHKTGEADLLLTTANPWGNSFLKSNSSSASKQERVTFFDLSSYLSTNQCLLKLDIEGGEYAFFDNYNQQLDQVFALIIEWHAELGDISKSEGLLKQAGLIRTKRSWNNGNRIVDLYVRA